MSNKPKNISLVQLSSYIKPDIEEYHTGRTDYVTNGKNNSFFQYVIDRFNGSPTNESVINVYSSLLYGRGIVINGEEDLYDELNEIFNKTQQRQVLNDFKLFGMASVKLVRSVGGGVAMMKHFPINKLAMGVSDDKGNINKVYYSYDWDKTWKYKPIPLPIFQGKMTDKEMILLIKPYQSGNFYYSYPDYLAGLQYCEIEEEISNFSINHIKNGLSFGYVINMNNGASLTPGEKDEIERRIKQKLTGSENAGKFILSFNDGKEAEVTVTPLNANVEAHHQWESLREDAAKQILVAHGVTSPLLFGMPSAGGFGANADELDTASKLLNDYQILPKQEQFLDAIKPALELAGLETDLEFLPLRETYGVEETEEEDVEDNTVEDIEENLELSNHVCLSDNMEATPELADHLISFGTEINEDEYELLAVNEVDYETDDVIYQALQFATSTGVARPNARSEQDSEDIAIRYRYVGNPLPQREFCQKMMFANKLYRKEDILQMERSGINDGFGLGGSNSYSIWLWKGGGKISTKYPNGTCKHKWQREIYLKRGGGVDVNSPLAKTIRTQDARRKGYKVPNNNRNVGITPHQNKG